MTAYFSYIGSMEGKDFQWESPPESSYHSNLPRRLVPADPLYHIGINVLWVMREIDAGACEGKQLDWGAWGLKMTGAALRTLFGETHAYADAIWALDPDEPYVLVAGELW